MGNRVRRKRRHCGALPSPTAGGSFVSDCQTLTIPTRHWEANMRATRWLAGSLLLTALAGAALAQPFPSKPVTMIVPYAPGGNVDISTRILQAGIGDALGQPIVIENRAGAGGTIAGAYVARSAPDGHTLFVGSNGPIMLGPMTMPKPPYQWDQAFAPVSSLAFATNMLLVRSSLPVKSVAELVAYAKKNPGKLTLAT